MYWEHKCLAQRSSVFLSKYPPHPEVLLGPAGPSGWSRGLNKPRPRYCNPTRQFSKSSHGLSAGTDGASIQERDGSVGRTCRKPDGAWRGGDAKRVTTPRRNG